MNFCVEFQPGPPCSSGQLGQSQPRLASFFCHCSNRSLETWLVRLRRLSSATSGGMLAASQSRTSFWKASSSSLKARRISLLRSAVILSAAKDLMPVASGDEVLRYAQDDRYERAGRPAVRRVLLLRLLLLVLAPALLLGFEERGEDLADGALGDVAGDEHDAALAVVALGPGVERRRRMEDMLHAVD